MEEVIQPKKMFLNTSSENNIQDSLATINKYHFFRHEMQKAIIHINENLAVNGFTPCKQCGQMLNAELQSLLFDEPQQHQEATKAWYSQLWLEHKEEAASNKLTGYEKNNNR